jgi:hypothetical protein
VEGKGYFMLNINEPIRTLHLLALTAVKTVWGGDGLRKQHTKQTETSEGKKHSLPLSNQYP